MIRSIILLVLIISTNCPVWVYLIWSVDLSFAVFGDWMKFRKFWQQFADLKADLSFFNDDYNRHETSQTYTEKISIEKYFPCGEDCSFKKEACISPFCKSNQKNESL